mmetsp:Transcript_12222/g.26736  ORF Transcript_12222/g.26736 Transcript_12222/m.26736 type:complete len:435 (+) Transcript_12222:895-2199(+)
MIVRLNKAMYGTIIAAKLWYERVTKTFRELGFKHNEHDECVMTRGDPNNKEFATVLIHVDDVKVFPHTEKQLGDVIEHLETKHRHVEKHRGREIEYVGMNFRYNSDGTVTVSKPKYINDLLAETQTNKTASTPESDDLFGIKASPGLSIEDAEHFHAIVYKMLYLAKRMRPDILLPVALLTTRVQSPTKDNARKMNRISKYLKRSEDLVLTLGAKEPLEPTSAVDVSFAVHTDMISHTGAVLTLGRGELSAQSKKQKLVTKSSTEAELVGASDSLGQVIWATILLKAAGYEVSVPVLQQDNTSTIALIHEGRSSSRRTRHINIRYFFLSDKVKRDEVRVAHCPSPEMVADVLTKPLQGKKFIRFRKSLLGMDAKAESMADKSRPKSRKKCGGEEAVAARVECIGGKRQLSRPVVNFWRAFRRRARNRTCIRVSS